MNSFGIAFLVILSLFVVVEIVQLVRVAVKYIKRKKAQKNAQINGVVEDDNFNN